VNGFPSDPGTPAGLVGGLDHRFPSGWLAGLAFSVGTQKAQFDMNFGSFRQDEFAVSAYAAQSFGPAWLRLIGTYGAIKFGSNRTVPIGVAILPNIASATGSNLSLAANTGIDVRCGAVTHGPIVGLTVQRVRVGTFTESGSFTALTFDEQIRYSAVSALGYQLAVDLGRWRPFAKAAWDHEWVANDRQVTASLTTVAAPSFSLPAVALGRDWGAASVGTTYQVTDRVTAIAAFVDQFAQHRLSIYGGQVGLNAAF
jgi:outer membrane lipase/esterase